MSSCKITGRESGEDRFQRRIKYTSIQEIYDALTPEQKAEMAILFGNIDSGIGFMRIGTTFIIG